MTSISQRIWLIGIVWLQAAGYSSAQSLERELRNVTPSELAHESWQAGDAQRGAVVFHQPLLACARCHVTDSPENRLGPDLTKLGADVSDEHLIESVLLPSKSIRPGYEAVSVTLSDGRRVSGIMMASTEREITIRDTGPDSRVHVFPRDEVEQVDAGTVSIMPDGQVDSLHSRQQFLDLMRYLFEIRNGGEARARQLAPPASSLSRSLPEYERHIDHAGFVREFGHEAYRRGAEIYGRLCVNCHGTVDRPGSLPTSPRFAEARFKNGSDPYAMYQTLTHGFGMMVAQTGLVPSQKYDVIHYIREAYLKGSNPSQYVRIDQSYLDRLPPGDTRGPEPSRLLPWQQMDYGPNLVLTLEIGNDATNIAYKGNAIRLDAGPGGVSWGQHWMVYDYDTLRVAGAWSGDGFCDWQGISFDGQHNVHAHAVGKIHLENPIGPGWANADDGRFADGRLMGRDGRRYGPLPRSWAHFQGMYAHGANTILRYTVGESEMLELPGVQTSAASPVFTRCFNVGPGDKELVLQVAYRSDPHAQWAISASGDIATFKPSDDGIASHDAAKSRITGSTIAGLSGDCGTLQWFAEAGYLRLRIPARQQRLKFTLWFAQVDRANEVARFAGSVAINAPDQDLNRFTQGGSARWPQVLPTEVILGGNDRPFAVDVLQHPTDDPWSCRMRLTGLDFTPDGKQLIVCDWDGGVWLVGGIDRLPENSREGKRVTAQLTWRRIASGLFQPLGLKVVHGKILVTCRDQLCRLHDLNGDGEIDYYENFNNDHQVTDHFHEFAMGLQVDSAGNCYYAKSARHALPALVPQHGTLLRVSPDGSRTDILATGFRAANGVCLNPDGTFIVTDQEGHWNPKNRINFVRPGRFYGNMFGYHDVTDSADSAMEQPMCWITNAFDRSPAELLWVDSPRWGPLHRRLLNLSYGYGMVYIVPHEDVAGQKQGGMCALPIERFPTGIMRGRFHPRDGQLYLCGMYSWAGNQIQPGGLYRLRYTGQPVHLPAELRATRAGMTIQFSGDLDAESATRAGNYGVKVWSLQRTAEYGSPHYDERELAVAAVELDKDGRTVHLRIPEIGPTWCMEIDYRLRSSQGQPVAGTIHNTIHRLGN